MAKRAVRRMIKYSWVVLGVGLFMVPAACRLYREDRCFVEDNQYRIAYNLFVESGSVDLVQRQLKDFQWRRCEINEVVYRLQKEFEVVEREA